MGQHLRNEIQQGWWR